MGNGRRKNRLCGHWLGSITHQLPQGRGHLLEAGLNQACLPFGRTNGGFLKDVVHFNGLTPIGSRKPSQEQIRNDAGFVHLQ